MNHIKVVQTFPDVGESRTDLIKKLIDLGWVVTGSRSVPETPHERKGVPVLIFLEWPEHLGEPVDPE